MTFLSCGGSAVVIVHAWPVLPDCFLEVPADCAGNRKREALKGRSSGLSPGATRATRIREGPHTVSLSEETTRPGPWPRESTAGSATINTGRWLAPPPGRGGLHQLHLNGAQSPALRPGPCPQVPGWRGRGHPPASTPRPVARTEEHTEQQRHDFTVLSPAAPCTSGPHGPDSLQGQGPRQRG